MFRTTAILVVLLGLLGGAMWQRLEMLRARPAEPTGHVLLGWDVSLSYPRDCGQISGQVVTAAIDAVPVTKDSTFSLIVTGGGETSSHEPRLVLPGVSIPRGDQQMVMRVRRDGPSRTEFIQAVRETCESLEDEPSTSLLRTIEVGLDHLRSRCAAPGLCLFLIGTDLRETVNREVARYLSGKGQATGVTKLDPGPVRLVLCGYAETVGGGDPVEDGQERLTRFRDLFAGDIELRPYCDGSFQIG